MKFMKRILAVISAVALIVSVSACGAKEEEESTSSLTSDDRVVAEVNGVEITAQDMRYYFINANYQLYSVFLSEHPEIEDGAALEAAFSWDDPYESTGETYAEYSRRTALEEAIADAVKVQKAEELGLSLTDEALQDIIDYVDGVEEDYADDFEEALAQSGLTSKQDFVDILTRIQTIDNLESDFETNTADYITDEAELEAYMNDSQVTAKHILIAFDYTDENGEDATRTSEEAYAIAQEVMDKLNAGEDFDELMAEYNEDTAETSSGYTFGKGEMVQEFEDASFALGANEISDIVETSYGYHIIKRIIGYSELVAKWEAEADIVVYDDVYAEVPVELEIEKPYTVEESSEEDADAETEIAEDAEAAEDAEDSEE